MLYLTNFGGKTLEIEAIEGFYGYYITKRGEIYCWNSGKREEVRQINTKGYSVVFMLDNNLKLTSRTVHSLMAVAFLGGYPTPKHVVNHIDGNKSNNNISNLEVVTQKQNTQHAYDVGLHISLKGERVASSKLTAVQVRFIRAAASMFKTSELARAFRVTGSTIRNIINKKSWRHL